MQKVFSFSVSSKKRVQAIDVTPQVESIVSESGVGDGVALLFVPHTTCALFCNEFEPGLERDYEKFFSEIARGGWNHDSTDDNAPAHLVSSLVGVSKNFLVESGKLVLGSWQAVVLLELDGPRERRVLVKIIS